MLTIVPRSKGGINALLRGVAIRRVTRGCAPTDGADLSAVYALIYGLARFTRLTEISILHGSNSARADTYSGNPVMAFRDDPT
jgi:hypothetical protein